MAPALASPGLGIAPLDRLLGPVPRGATIVLLNDPGVDADAFLLQAAAAHLDAGHQVVYATTHRAPASVERAMLEMGFDAPREASRRGQLLFVDAYSALLGVGSDATYVLHDATDPAAFAMALEQAGTDHPEAVLVVDSLSSLIDQAGWERVALQAPRLHAALRRFRLAAALVTRWPYAENLDALLLPFDGVVTLKGVEERVLFRQYFAVERASWRTNAKAQPADAKPKLYKVLKPGGVVCYVPKVLVTGPGGAGKSSFVRACSDVSASADHAGTTVAMDHGQVTMEGLSCDLFGTPGQSRFDPLIKHLSEQALGVIVVVNSADPASFPRAREMMQATWKEGLPAILCANQQDLPGALPPDEVKRLLGAPDHVRVVGCVARDPAQAKGVLRSLLDQILMGGTSA